jgi:NAD(P)-dependent dehydrogenase (short-subunit alcohol dehydrogenase family)
MTQPYAGQFVTPGRYAGKVVVVTGSAQGIGQKVAERIGAEGGAVVLVDRAELVHGVANGIQGAAQASGSGGSATSVTADLETFAGAQHAVEAALAAHGRVDVLVNNVGGTIQDPDEFARTNEEFHEYLFMVCDNPMLLESYRRLDVHAQMAAAFETGTHIFERVTQDHVDVVDAFERQDKARVREVIMAHARDAKETMAVAIDAKGNR